MIDSIQMEQSLDGAYEAAVKIVLEHQRASPSLVQRNLRISYKNSAFLIDQMVQNGIVSAMDASGNRKFIKEQSCKTPS